jgi:hypothetical protein
MGLQAYMVSVDSSDRLENGLNEMVNAKLEGVIVVRDALIFAKAANDAWQLEWAVGFGHGVIATGGPRLFFIPFHGK